jgi:hypothetical protein
LRRQDDRSPQRYLFASSGNLTGGLAELRRQGFPQVVYPAPFGAREAVAQPPWLSRLSQRFTRQALIALFFAAVLAAVATAIPAWSALQNSDTTSRSYVTRSSIGVTGTAATRVEDLGVTTFVGQIPFVQHMRYLNTLAGVAPEPALFVQGAREANLAQYVQSVGVQVTLPYLNETVQTKTEIDAWTDAVAAQQRQYAAIEQQDATYRLAVSQPVFQTPALAGGTRIAGSTVTFYSCLNNGFCGTMASGAEVFSGAAACSIDMPFGTRFVIASDPTGRVFTCLDRGALAPPWVDVWFYDDADGWAWQSIVGTRSDLMIVP